MKRQLVAGALVLFLACSSLSATQADDEAQYLGDAIRSIAWLRERAAPNGWSLSGMILATDSPDETRGFLYDQVMTLIAFTLFGLEDESSAIVSRLKGAQNPDGSWFNQYDLKTGEPADSARYAGSIAWTVFAISFYARKFSDDPAKLVAQSAANFLLRLQANNGGFYGGYEGNKTLRWRSVENNVGAYFAFSLLRENIANDTLSSARDGIRSWILTQGWNDQRRFNAGEADPSVFLDAQSLGAIFMRSIERKDEARSALAYAQDNLLGYYKAINGFRYRPEDQRVWFEGSLQMAVAYSSLNDPIMAARLIQEAARADKAINFDGGIPNFSDGSDQSSATAWFSIAVAAYCGKNPFVQNAITGSKCW